MATLQTNKPKILLTGASGFVGRNFINQLSKKYDITALVRESSDTKGLKNCDIIKFSNLDSLENTFKTHAFTGIVHLATLWSNTHNLESINSMMFSNITFGVYLLEMAKKYKLKFFINTATFASYANSLNYNPATLYAASKSAFIDIMRYFSLTSECVFCSLLLFNVYGIGDRDERFVPLLLKAAKSRENLLLSDGLQIVDYSYISDVISGFDCLIDLLLSESNSCRDKIFALQGAQRMSLRAFVELFANILKKNTNLELNITWGAREKRELEIMLPWEGGEKLPNWIQQVSLESGFSKLIEASF